MNGVFFIVGPTAVGKSEIAAEVAARCQGEIVSADAYQIYAGLDLLTAKPDRATLERVPHHLIATASPADEMNAEIFRRSAMESIAAIQSRGHLALVVGGSGMYVKALTHGLSALPSASAALRERLAQFTARELFIRLAQLDPETAAVIDRHNQHRLVRAVEVCLLSGRRFSEQRDRSESATTARGVLLFRGRAELYRRINERVEMMFASGVVDEVRALRRIGVTAAKTLGLAPIRE